MEIKAYDIAELFLSSGGAQGEKELREYVARGGDIHERDRDGMSAMDIALATELQSKKMRMVAPLLVQLIESLSK